MTTTERRVEISVDPRLLPIIGRSLYKGHPLPILVRELLQNARDAHVHEGTEPNIIITLDEFGDHMEVTVEDEGIGMSVDDLHTKFLRLGATNKGKDEVGGFGIAKAAIMSHPKWEVHTRDNFVSYEMLLNNEPYRKTKERKGTRVSVTTERAWGWDSEIDTILMIVMSEVNVRLIITKENKPKHSIDDYGMDCLAHVKSEASALSGDYKDQFSDQIKLRIFDKFKTDATMRDIKTMTIVRIGGLVQFIKHGWSSRESNLVFDLFSPHPPDHKDYPLTISREEIKDPLGKLVRSVIQYHDVNSLTADRKLEEHENKDEKVIAGYLLAGLGQHTVSDARRICKWTEDEMQGFVNAAAQEATENGDPEDLALVAINNWFIDSKGNFCVKCDGSITKLADKHDAPKVILAMEKIAKIKLPEPVRKVAADHFKNVATLVYHYENKSKAVAARHAKIIKVWKQILQLVAEPDDYFGIGVIGDHWIDAQRHPKDKIVYYLINPFSLEENVKTVEGKVLTMWSIACHETSHVVTESHDESFTTDMGDRMKHTSERIYLNLMQLAAQLK